MHSIDMARNARALSDSLVSRLDLNWLTKVFQGERQRMVEAIVGLRQERSQMIVRQVAVVAHGHMAMR